MPYRRRLILGSVLLVSMMHSRVGLAQPAAATEASLRSAAEKYVATWNRHDVSAWAMLLADDIWYSETLDWYKRMTGRKAVIAYHGDLVKTTDLKWEIVKYKFLPDGTATMVVKHHAQFLPKTGGKYASSFVSDPTVARWRVEGGQWRMFFFTSHKGSAIDAMKKDGIE